MEETGCEFICGAPTTPALKGQVKVNDVFCNLWRVTFTLLFSLVFPSFLSIHTYFTVQCFFVLFIVCYLYQGRVAGMSLCLVLHACVNKVQ